MPSGSNLRSPAGLIVDMFERIGRQIAIQRSVDVGGKSPFMFTTLTFDQDENRSWGYTKIPLFSGKAKYEGFIMVTFYRQLEAVEEPAPTKVAQNKVRANARDVAKKIGDLGVHYLMIDVLDILTVQGAIILPAPVEDSVENPYRGFIYSHRIHRVIRGFFPFPGNKAIYFRIDRAYTKPLKTRIRVTKG